MIDLTPSQLKLVVMYAQRAQLKVPMVVEWVEEWDVTIQELKEWILGKALDPYYYNG